MWPFKRTPVADIRLLEDEVQKLKRSVFDIHAQLEDLMCKHITLRGRVYGSGLHKKPLKDSEEEQSATMPASKDQLRKIAGIIPGRPYPHKDDQS